MDDSLTINQMQLQALAHEVCRSHSARPERDIYRICPSKLSKRELEDLYFALLENNLELKRTINSQNDKLKMLSTKVQRLSASKTMGSKDKDCCHSKTLINDHKDSITELKKCNERMSERIRVLNMKLCSAKQFLKKQSPDPKNSSKSPSKNPTSFQKFKNICDHSHGSHSKPAIEYKISKSVEPSPENPLAIASPKQESAHQCNENKCRTAIEELQKKISELQEELHITQYNYTSKLLNLENEIRSVMEENVRARADSRTLAERGDELASKLRAAEGRGADLDTQLAIEKLKVKELETRLKLADNDKNLAKSIDQLTVIREKRDSDASSPSYKFRPRQSISEPKNEYDVDSAVSYYKPEQKESESSVKSAKEPKRSVSEEETMAPVPSQKSYQKGSQSSVKIKEPKSSEPEAGTLTPVSSQKSIRRNSQTSVKIKEPKSSEPETGTLTPVSSQKSYRRDSQSSVKIKEPKHRDSKVQEAPPKSPKGARKQSISEPKPRHSKDEGEPPKSPKGDRKQSITEPKHRDSKVEEEPLKSPSKAQRKQSISPQDSKVEEPPKSPSKSQRKQSITEPNPQDSKVEEKPPKSLSKSQRKQSITELKPQDSEEPLKSPSKIQRKQSITELKPQDSEEPLKSPSKSHRKQSITELKPRASKVEEEPPKSPYKSQRKQSITEPKPQDFKVEEGPPKSPKGQRKQSISETKPQSSKNKHELSSILTNVPHRRESSGTPEITKPIKASQVKFPKSDDSGYTDPNKSFDVQPNQDEEMLRINRDLLKKIAELKSQLDLLMISAAGAKLGELAPAQSKTSAAETKMMEDHSAPTKSLSTNSAKVPKEIEPNQQVQAKTEDNVKRITSSVKPEVDQNPGLIPKQLTTEDDLLKYVPHEDKDQQPFSFKDSANNVFSSDNFLAPSDKNKPLADEKSPISNNNQIDQPIPYEIRAPRSSLYPELQKAPQQIQEVKPIKESDVIIHSSNENKMSMPEPSYTNESKIHLIDGKTRKPSDEKLPMPSSSEASKQPNVRTLSIVSTYEDTPSNLLPYQERPLTSSPNSNKAQNSNGGVPFEYESPRESRLHSFHPFGSEVRKPAADVPDPILYEDTRSKSQLEIKKLNSEEKMHQNDIVDKKRRSLFYKDEVSDFDVDLDKVERPNVNKRRGSLFYEEMEMPSLPFEDKIYPEEPQFKDDKTRTDQYLNQEEYEKPRRSSCYTERIEKFALDNNAPSTSSPYEEKMQKLNTEKLHPEDDTKGIRFESYIHMAESGGSKDYGPQFPKYDEDTAENDLRRDKRTSSKLAWCSAAARICTCTPGPPISTLLRTCSGTQQPAPPHMRYCACCTDKNLQAPGGTPRRDSATYTQPQTYTLPNDSYKQPRRESFNQKPYSQYGTDEYPQQRAYKRDTYTQVGPRYSRSTSPDNTEKEISSLPDLPQERETKPIHGYLSPGEKATMTFTDNETNTDYGSLSEGELPSTKKATKAFGEKSVETTSGHEESPTRRMEDVLKSISEELARCHRLLASQKGEERTVSEVNKPSEDEVVELRASQGTRRLTGAHHVCVFTLHVGTLILSDEALLQSRDKSLVLIWRFYDQSVTMTRTRPGRVVPFDFSTEYDVVFSEDFLNYMKFEKMPLLICEINKQDKPFARCYLPLRDALLHVNRRADMSLALTGPSGDYESSPEEMGVLDLWCVLRCDAVITQHLNKSMARPSTAAMSPRRSYHHSIAEEDLSLFEDLDLNIKKESQAHDTYPQQMPMNNKKSYSGYYAADGGSHLGGSLAAVDDLSLGTFKGNRRSSIAASRSTLERQGVNFDGASNKLSFDASGLIANAVPSSIRSAEEMKAALERNAIQDENRKSPEERSLSRKNMLSKLKFSKKLSEDIGSLQELIRNKQDRKNSQPKYELPPDDKTENELVKKYNDITKLMVSRMDAAKKSVKYHSDDDEQPQRIQGIQRQDPSPQSIEITVLWLALNEECDAMLNPSIKRLYVAYKFLGRNGAELETPVSLPKPKHYVDKCFFNFKKTFHLHDADLPALGHMARVRAGTRVSTDPRDCLVFTVVSEPPEDPLGLASCEDVGYAYLYLGDILAYASGSGAYTEVVAVHAARGSAVCGVLAVKIDGLHVLRRALTLSHSSKDLVMAH